MRSFLAALLLLSTPAFAQHDHGKPAGETAFGRPGNPKAVSRTIEIDMSDKLRFTPSVIEVKQGETIRFRAKNSGQTLHEMVLGTKADLKKHAEDMRKKPGMKHDAPYLTHVAPGKTGSIVWQFTKAGEFEFACLVPGHFEGGMIGQIKVSGKNAALSEQQIEQYRAGAGMGYAKAAELNRYPGPMHVLELADKLALTPEQHAATERLMKEHKAQARAIGARLVEAQESLDELFRAGGVEQAALAKAVEHTGRIEAQYRLSHLETHRRMRALLTEEQVAQYDKLRR